MAQNNLRASPIEALLKPGNRRFKPARLIHDSSILSFTGSQGSLWTFWTGSNPRTPRRHSLYNCIVAHCTLVVVFDHLSVNFWPAMTGAAAVDLEFALPHMAHAV